MVLFFPHKGGQCFWQPSRKNLVPGIFPCHNAPVFSGSFAQTWGLVLVLQELQVLYRFQEEECNGASRAGLHNLLVECGSPVVYGFPPWVTSGGHKLWLALKASQNVYPPVTWPCPIKEGMGFFSLISCRILEVVQSGLPSSLLGWPLALFHSMIARISTIVPRSELRKGAGIQCNRNKHPRIQSRSSLQLS